MMNEFTKEELLKLHQSLTVAINEGAQYYARERINLRIKIKSMIDNYCEYKEKEIK